jgi:very-short-patch-repair endonuclease
LEEPTKPTATGEDARMSLAMETLIADLARRQHGVATRAQLLEAGLTARMMERRLKAERFRSLHRGVYLLTPVAPARAREMAAALACGPGAVVSHQNAAWLWTLLPALGDAEPVHVSVPRGRDPRHRSGIRTHRVTAFGPAEVTAVDGIPVTAPARTLLDLAGTVGARELERAVARAEREQLATRGDILSLMARYPGRRGTRALRRLLRSDERPALTRSEAEERFLTLVRRGGLPAPAVNTRVGRYEVDFLWRSEGLAVEVDGYQFHSSPSRFESDRRRDAELAAVGIHVIRVTWRQLVDRPEQTLAMVARALGRAGAR